MKIRKNLCDASKYGVKCPFTRRPDRIVVHNTGNDAPAANEIQYMLRRPEEVSFHFAVDDQEAVQGLPLDRNAWASGDGRGQGNMLGIHVEICWSKSGGERFRKAEENGAELIAGLLKEYGWGLERVTKHEDYDGKYCPHRTLDLGWGRFLAMVETFMKEEKEEMLSYEEFKGYMDRYWAELAKKDAADWAKEAIAVCREKGIMTGDGQGFRGRSFVTRQELAQVAARLAEGRAEA